MKDEFLNMEMPRETEETEKPEAAEETGRPEAAELQARQYWEKYRKAFEQGDMAAARYYMGKYSDMYSPGTEEKEADEAEAAESYLGKSETEEEKEAREQAAERSRLERKLRDAQQKLEHSVSAAA